ncbi:MAG: cytochrome c-type biogenesis protein [Pseudomonadota bacterium]
MPKSPLSASLRAAFLSLSLLLSGPLLAIDPQDFESPAQEERYWALIEELRCLVCQNQNLADSDATLAKDLRDQVLEMMVAGQSNDQIKSFLAERYGDFVLYRPPVKPATWGLWFGPLVLVLIGGMALVFNLRRRRALPAQVLADPDQEELDRELAKLEAEREGKNR